MPERWPRKWETASDLVDLDRGLVSREVYVNEEIFHQEMEQIFARSWLFVGHESQVPNPNDYALAMMGNESVVLTRDREGEIHVLLNTCRHRGMKIVRYDEGNTPIFSCPYHGWSYSCDGNLVDVPGALVGVPQYKTAYREKLDKVEWGLINVAKMVNYKGTIWATWDPEAPSFEDYMGDLLMYLDFHLSHRDGRDGGSEVVGGVIKWRFPGNWKFPAENFGGDPLHTISHRSVEIVGIGPGGVGQQRNGSRPGGQTSDLVGGQTVFDLGHAVHGPPFVYQDDDPFPIFASPTGPLDRPKIVDEYFRHMAEERKKRLAGQTIAMGGASRIFPNFTWHGSWFPRDICVWHPIAPHVTEAWRWLLVDRDAPKEVKDLARHHYLRYSGPAGMTEQDDMENWNYATAASSGVIARRYPYNLQLRLGEVVPAPGLRGAWWAPRPSEHNQRGFYKRWAEVMDADDWSGMFPARPFLPQTTST